MNVVTVVVRLLQSGLGSLAAYLAAHVLLCLLPAFFVAGALSALVPQETVTRYLGPTAPRRVSYPAAALGGFVLAVCSCTIMPLFAGIYKKGAGLGPAVTFLFVGPAVNVLALTYTGVALGMDIAVARIVLSVLFGIGIGLIMSTSFRSDEVTPSARQSDAFASAASVPRPVLAFLALLIGLLIVGTLQIGALTDDYAQLTLPIRGIDRVQAGLDRLVPSDSSRGEEGVSVQGALLIGLLLAVGISAWLGFDQVDQGFRRSTWVSLTLTALTLVFASLGSHVHPGGLDLHVTGRTLGVATTLVGLVYVAARHLDVYQVQEWLWETWRFVKQIFPLLIVGVFAVGVIRGLIDPAWIQALAGRNSLLANVVGVLFGVFMYFPTLVEVPVASMFLRMGMHRGPLLAYLMSDPELSLQSILITSRVIGKAKAWVYVALVAVFSTLAGLAYGAWVDGASPLAVGFALLGALATLSVSLHYVWGRRQSLATRPQVRANPALDSRERP